MLDYNGMPVLASGAVVRKDADVTVEIGPPQIVAARDESPDEGIFTAPRITKIHLWSDLTAKSGPGIRAYLSS